MIHGKSFENSAGDIMKAKIREFVSFFKVYNRNIFEGGRVKSDMVLREMCRRLHFPSLGTGVIHRLTNLCNLLYLSLHLYLFPQTTFPVDASLICSQVYRHQQMSLLQLGKCSTHKQKQNKYDKMSNTLQSGNTFSR